MEKLAQTRNKVPGSFVVGQGSRAKRDGEVDEEDLFMES